MNHRYFHTAVTLMKGFFVSKGCLELQERSLDEVEVFGSKNLTPSAHILLERSLLEQPDASGFFYIGKNSSSEKNYHSRLEFEIRGDVETLLQREIELLIWLGFDGCHRISHDAVTSYYHTDRLTPAHEFLTQKDIHPITCITEGDGVSKQVEIILYGMKAITSAGRNNHLDDLENVSRKEGDAVPRSGGVIDIHRIIGAMEKAGLFMKHIELAGLKMEVMKGVENR